MENSHNFKKCLEIKYLLLFIKDKFAFNSFIDKRLFQFKVQLGYPISFNFETSDPSIFKRVQTMYNKDKLI